jgi:hypothetical protein
MIHLPGSYQQGFAPRDFEPRFPELWRGCVLALAPCLGPTGTVVRDWGGCKKDATLNNMTPDSDWVASQGRFALDTDGVNDFLSVVPPISSTAILTVSGWWFQSAFNNSDHLLMEHTTNSNTIGNNSFVIGPNSSAGVFSVVITGPGTTGVQQGYNVRNYARPTANQWNHFSVILNRNLGTAASAIRLFLNGVEQTSTGSFTQGNVSGNFANSTTYICSRAGTSLFLAAQVDDMIFHNRGLSPQEIRLLAMRRGVAYEPRIPSYPKSQQPNRRRRLLTGMV